MGQQRQLVGPTIGTNVSYAALWVAKFSIQFATERSRLTLHQLLNVGLSIFKPYMRPKSWASSAAFSSASIAYYSPRFPVLPFGLHARLTMCSIRICEGFGLRVPFLPLALAA